MYTFDADLDKDGGLCFMTIPAGAMHWIENPYDKPVYNMDIFPPSAPPTVRRAWRSADGKHLPGKYIAIKRRYDFKMDEVRHLDWGKRDWVSSEAERDAGRCTRQQSLHHQHGRDPARPCARPLQARL